MRALLGIVLLLCAGSARADECADPRACVRACKKKDPAACVRLAELARAGIDEKKLEKRALKTLERACKKGSSEDVCFQYGYTLVRRHNMGPQGSHGYTLLDALCRKNHIASCMHVAAMHESKDGVALDLDRAEKLYDTLCTAKHPPACLRLARLRERTGRKSETVPDLLMAACAGGVTAGCQRQIALARPEKPSDAYAWEIADRFVDDCLHRRRDWIDRWWNQKMPWPTLAVVGHGAPAAALGDAIAAFPAVKLEEPVAYVVVPDLDEVAVDVRGELITHRVWSATLHEAWSGVPVCRESVEIATFEKLPPLPEGAEPPPACMLSDRRVAQRADAMAADILAAPWISGFKKASGRVPRVRLQLAINKTRRYLDLNGLLEQISKRLSSSEALEALPRDSGVPDVVGVLRVEELSDTLQGRAVSRWQVQLQLVSSETGQIVWLGERVLHFCPDRAERGCVLPGAEMRSLMLEMVGEGMSSMAVDNYSRCPMNATHLEQDWLSKLPTIRLRGVSNKTDEHIEGLASAAVTAMVHDGRFSVLATGAALDAVEELSKGRQLGAGLVMTVGVVSVADENVKFYKLWGEILNSNTGDKLWIGNHEEKLFCEPSGAQW